MRNNQKCQKCFGTGRVFMAGGPTQQCDCFITNPAPKEEEIEFAKTQCAGCGTTLLNLESCQRCTARTAERRALARDAYMAALGTLGEYTAYSDLVTDCQTVAIETVRRWDAFMAAVDAEGAE